MSITPAEIHILKKLTGISEETLSNFLSSEVHNEEENFYNYDISNFKFLYIFLIWFYSKDNRKIISPYFTIREKIQKLIYFLENENKELVLKTLHEIFSSNEAEKLFLQLYPEKVHFNAFSLSDIKKIIALYFINFEEFSKNCNNETSYLTSQNECIVEEILNDNSNDKLLGQIKKFIIDCKEKNRINCINIILSKIKSFKYLKNITNEESVKYFYRELFSLIKETESNSEYLLELKLLQNYHFDEKELLNILFKIYDIDLENNNWHKIKDLLRSFEISEDNIAFFNHRNIYRDFYENISEDKFSRLMNSFQYVTPIMEKLLNDLFESLLNNNQQKSKFILQQIQNAKNPKEIKKFLVINLKSILMIINKFHFERKDSACNPSLVKFLKEHNVIFPIKKKIHLEALLYTVGNRFSKMLFDKNVGDIKRNFISSEIRNEQEIVKSLNNFYV